MPTPIPSGDKNNFIAIVSAMDPNEANILPSILNNYEDIFTVFNRELQLFNCNLNGMLNAMLCFTGTSDLHAAGIYVNSSSSPLTDPQLVVNSTAAVVNYTTADDHPQDVIYIGPVTAIGQILLPATVKLNTVYIGAGATVKSIDASASTAGINTIQLNACSPGTSILNQVVTGSAIGKVIQNSEAYYGGVSDYDVTASCSHPVTSPVTSDPTNTGFKLSWTNPTSTDFLYVVVEIKNTGDITWSNPLNDNTGSMPAANVFVFRNLESDTYYDYRVTSYCTNGVPATPVTGTIETTCV